MSKVHGGSLMFEASKILQGWAKHCKGHTCGNAKITVGQKYWRSTSKNSRYILCQKCFGFWLARYTKFDYDPFHIDAIDLKWERHWTEQAKNYAAEIFVENMIKKADVQIA